MSVLANYKKKHWTVKLKEMLISLFFLRPAVDAFRVSTNHTDDEANFDPLHEMLFNKVSDDGSEKRASRSKTP